MRRPMLLVGAAILALVMAAQVVSAEEAARKGKVVGSVITTGPKRVVIQKAEGGQMTLEPGWVNTGGGWHQDEKQIAFFATLKQGDQIEANWVLDGTHYQVESIKRAGEAGGAAAPETEAREGKIAGTVITTGEASVVIQKAEGGQMTLEPRWIQTNGAWGRSQEQIAFIKELKQGDKVTAAWRKGDGNHFIIMEIARDGAAPAAEGHGQPAPAMAAEIRALRAEIGGLRQEIANLKALIDKLAEQKK